MKPPKPLGTPPPFLKREDLFPNGKHKGESVASVAINDPAFIIWGVGRREFKVSPAVLGEAQANKRWQDDMDAEGFGGNEYE